MAAAQQLLGTAASTGNATTAADQALAANQYNFGSLTVGQTTGNLTSTVNPPVYYATVTDEKTGAFELSGSDGKGTAFSRSAALERRRCPA